MKTSPTREENPHQENLTEQRQKEIFDRLVIRVKEELQRKHPTLTYFVDDGEKTKELSKNIPIAFLKCILWYYRLFQEACKKLWIPDFPIKDFKNIKSLLNNLKRAAWLKENNVVEIMGFIAQKMLISERGYQSEHGRSIINNIEKGRVFWAGQTKILDTIKHGGAKKNIALDFLVFVLVKNLIGLTGKPKYKLIVDFLTEQKIYLIPSDNQDDHPNDIITVQKRYSRTSFGKLSLPFSEINLAYLKPILDGYTSINHIDSYTSLPEIPETKRLAFIDAIIPPLEKFNLMANQT